MLKKTPEVAVIVLNYNGIHLIDESLGSMLKQNFKNMQLYMADDASTDNSIDYVSKKYPNVKIIKGGVNRGTAGVSNFAVNEVKEPYIVLASNDMFFDKNCVKELYNTITSKKKAGICTSVLLKHEPFPDGLYHVDNAGFDVDIFGFIEPKYRDAAQKDLPKKTFETFATCGGCFIIRRDLYLKLGGFDNNFWSLSDDVDLCWRTRLLGFKNYTNPKSFLLHHMSATLKKEKQGKTRYLSERNNLTMLLKNYSGLTLVFLLPLYFITEFMEVIFHIFTGKPYLARSVILAIVDNFKKLSNTLAQRKTIQSTRVTPDSQIFRLLRKTSLKFGLALGQFIPNYEISQS
ncbi:MAG TPA: glycosyltransferase family 2 protein [Patescibacteria group bacterium]